MLRKLQAKIERKVDAMVKNYDYTQLKFVYMRLRYVCMQKKFDVSIKTISIYASSRLFASSLQFVHQPNRPLQIRTNMSSLLNRALQKF